MAQIYVAQERGQTQGNGFRSCHTFNFGAYQEESRRAFGALYVLNDDNLAGGKQLKMLVDEDSHIILLPIVGAIAFKNSLDTEGGYLSAGQVHIFSATKGMAFEIENPYETDFVNILQIWLKNTSQRFEPQVQTFDFDLLAHKNHLVPLFSLHTEGGICGRIGQFDGRTDGIYRLQNPKNGVFAFVIEGAFEVQHRLLEPRDGLALLDAKDVAFEALSNNALVLFLEINTNWSNIPIY